jgi:hypothetical protein
MKDWTFTFQWFESTTCASACMGVGYQRKVYEKIVRVVFVRRQEKREIPGVEVCKDPAAVCDVGTTPAVLSIQASEKAGAAAETGSDAAFKT